MEPTPRQDDRSAETGPAIEAHGRVVTTTRRAAAFYRRAQGALDADQAMAALRLAVDADPSFGVAIADLAALSGTTDEGLSRRQMSWERHHIEVVRTASTGDAKRAAVLLQEHLATVGCDPLAAHIAAQLRRPGAHDDDAEDLAGRLPGCHAARWPFSQRQR